MGGLCLIFSPIDPSLLALMYSERFQSGRNSDPITKTLRRENMEAQRSKSVDCSPSMDFKHGIPLGSLTAKLASKSFWSTEMLQKTLEEVTRCAAQEVNTSLCSSIESLNDSEREFSDMDINRISELSEVSTDHENMETEEVTIEQQQQQQQQRELRNPLSVFYRDCRGCQTPPYLSPGTTRKLLHNYKASL